MKEVVLRVHPMTRGVLLSELGCTEPIQITPNDLYFPLLTSAPFQEQASVKRSIPFLTDTIVIAVHDSVAAAIFRQPYHIGAALFRFHKDAMCRYAQCAVRRRGDAWAAIQEWLHLHQVDEDAYSMETAYKCWQRWNWNFEKKNPLFFSRIRRKAAANPAKKSAETFRLKMSMPACEIEQFLERFGAELSRRMKHIPKRLPAHARAYAYRQLGGLSEREAALVLPMPRASVGYACRVMSAWLERNRKVRAAWDTAMINPQSVIRNPQSVALLQVA